MHDPMVVAFTVRRPWPRSSSGGGRDARWSFRGCFWRIAGRSYYWPSMVTVWHVEPDGRDSGEVCKHYRRVQDADGRWQYAFLNGWKWHVHHWKIQVSPLQHLRRWALTRCAWCGGRSVKANPVNISHQWDGPSGRWWKGAPGLFHSRCSMVAVAAKLCACDRPRKPLSAYPAESGECQQCGLRFGWKTHEPWNLEQRRLLHTVPRGQQPSAELYEEAAAIYQRHKAAVE